MKTYLAEDPFGKPVIINKDMINQVTTATHASYECDCCCLFMAGGDRVTIKGTIEKLALDLSS